MILFYIRHGDPIYHPDSLTPLGHRQAEAAAKRLALFGLDEIYASTSVRAMQTAQPTAELTKLEIKPLEWMHENLALKEMRVPLNDKKGVWVWAHPKYSQLLASREVREMGSKWHQHPEFSEFCFENSLNRMGGELDAFLSSFGYEHDREKGMYKLNGNKQDREKRIAIFAHEGAGKIFMSELLDIPFPYYAEHFEMKHSGITAILFDEGRDWDLGGYARARVMTLSNDSHLYREGLPLIHGSTQLREKY